MPLALRMEVILHAEVQLAVATVEPDAAAPRQHLRLRNLGQPQRRPVERARLLLRAAWHGHLHMVVAQNLERLRRWLFAHGSLLRMLQRPALSRTPHR